MTTVRRRLLTTGALAALILISGLAARTALASSRSAAPARQTTPAARTITVAAQGQVQVAPDQATITLGVQTRATDAQAALSENASRMNAVISAVKAQGVAADHIQTSDLSIYYDSEKGVYVASHQVSVRLDDVNKVGSVLDAAVAAGANHSWGVSFGLKDPASAQARALQAAVASARKHADGIAAGLGVTLGPVRSASEPTYSAPVVYGSGVAPVGAPAAAAPTPVQPGQLTITANLTIVYTFG